MTFEEKLLALRKAFRFLDHRAALMVLVLGNLDKPPTEVFRAAWRLVNVSTSRQPRNDRFGVPPKHVRHYCLRHLIKLALPQYSPTVTFDPKVLEHMRHGHSVIVSIHARTEFAMCAALDQAGLQSAIVTAFDVRPAEMQNYDFAAPPQNILRDRDVFVRALAALRSGRVVVCDADFIVDKGLPSARVCISTAIFEFARRVNATLFFGYTQISDEGDMNCIFRPAPHADSAEEDAHRFIDFAADVQSEITNLTIGDWTRPA